jgi:hypothetical protein
MVLTVTESGVLSSAGPQDRLPLHPLSLLSPRLQVHPLFRQFQFQQENAPSPAVDRHV